MGIRPDRRSGVDIRAVALSALPRLPLLIRRWLPDGHLVGREWVALNPNRFDRNLGSFKVNISTGKWADFATGDRGGDVVSLAAYLFGLGQSAAASRISEMLGLSQ